MVLDDESFPGNPQIAERLGQRLKEAIATKDAMGTSLIAGHLPLVPLKLSMSTFELPVVEHSRRESYLKPYLDTCTEVLLADKLNWTPPGWKTPDMMRLWPLNNGGDGDCLFHGVSVALWGCRDEHKVLQKLVATVLDHDSEVLFNIWKQGRDGETEQRDWEKIMKFSLDKGSPYFYFFILANILRRAIIVISDEYCRQRDLSYIDSEELPPGGIYLPTLLEPDKCCPTPLVIGATKVGGFDHATTLVGVRGHLSHVRMTDKNGIRFPLFYGERTSWVKDVEAYMSIERFHATNGKMYYMARADESRVTPDRSMAIAEGMKRKGFIQGVSVFSEDGLPPDMPIAGFDFFREGLPHIAVSSNVTYAAAFMAVI